jgi:hypothetical protein
METSAFPGWLLIVVHAVRFLHRMVHVFTSMSCRCAMRRMPAKRHRQGSETLQRHP